MHLRFFAIALASLCMMDSTPSVGAARGGSVAGRVQVLENGKPKSDHSNVVVYLEGAPGRARDARRKHVIGQRNRQFRPQVSAVVEGTTVEFPNDDRIYHNVFSPSRPARFDLGLYRSGTSKSVKFKREGVVDVFCNIHPEMVARVVVLDTPYFAQTDSNGRFRINGVPPGTYPVVARAPYGSKVRAMVEVRPGRVAKLDFNVGAGKKPKQHRRKDGTPYGRYE